ncbi:hypothetical protein L218DRAFT_1081496 [Marasmius fiardii PR-910]|nr:hypothetical protein L218DRAFT_1081496 [Marasmius fiardii PR-910]
MAPTTTKTATSTSTSNTQASGSRNPVGFGSSAPRSSGPTKPSPASSSSTSTAVPSSSQPAHVERPLQSQIPSEPTTAPHSSVQNQSDANATVLDASHRRSSSYNSLFDNQNTPSSSHIATPEAMLAEMNRSAAKKGKAPMPNRPLIISGDQAGRDPDTETEAPADTDIDTRSIHSIRTVSSSFARNESLVRSYHATLRRCYVLQTMRDSDLMQYSTTRIEDQRIHVDERDMIYHERNPRIRQPVRPIEDDEVAPLRMIYPEPFSDQDPIHSRLSQRMRHIPSREKGEFNLPYQQRLRASLDRHRANTKRGRGGAHRGVSSRRTPNASSLNQQSPSGGPEPDPSDSEPDRSGRGNNSHGGGPPGSDPPGDPYGDSSDHEPHNSEDEYNRNL